MRYGSLCSGIEAASVAWEPIGWNPTWFAEIEKFPSAVLAYHWSDIANLGDMTKIVDMLEKGEIEAPDILVGGTPCQAFSVAGLRESLDDDRGQLSLEYIRILNTIDKVRSKNGKQPCICLWENVPGVLNTKDNAFGCFLGGLAGEDAPVESPGKRWTNAGYVLGPQRTVSWRVLDAQYFGVAQRRRRVFVIASAREGFDSRAILFESEGLRRDIAPSREKRQEVTPNASESSGSTDPVVVERAAFNQGKNAKYGFEADHGQVMPPLVARGPHGVAPDDWPKDIAPTLNEKFGDKMGLDDQHIKSGAGMFVPDNDKAYILRTDPQEMEVSPISTTLKARDYKEPQAVCIPQKEAPSGEEGSWYNGKQVADSLTTRCHSQFMPDKGNFAAVIAPNEPVLYENHPNDSRVSGPHEVCPAVVSRYGTGGGNVPLVQHPEGYREKFSDVHGKKTQTDCIGGQHPHAAADTEICPTITEAAGAGGGHVPIVNDKHAVCFQQNVRDEDRKMGGDGQIAGALQANSGAKQQNYVAEESAGFLPGQGSKAQGIGYEKEKCPTLRAGCDQYGVHQPTMQVRRLTPKECERLQGFPDGYTNIPFGRPKHDDQNAPDGHRYKALGNSMAVPVMAWIGKRIERYVNGEPIERERFHV